MSTRQMRRLQQLVAASTGVDGGERDEEEEDAVPSTMRPVNKKSKKAKKQHQQQQQQLPRSEEADTPPQPEDNSGDDVVDEDAEAEVEALHGTTGTTDGAKGGSRRKKKKGTASAPSETGTAAAAAKKDSKKALRSKKKRQDEAEEAALLEAALQRRVEQEEEGGGDHLGGALGSQADGAGGLSTDALLLDNMTRTDAARLDMRTERIRSFGPGAVEDVGDGSVPRHRADGRPTDTGSSSFFPEHGRRFHFRTCAFATPNRYRWPPFDGLGTTLAVVGRPEPPVLYRPDPADPEEVNYALDTSSPAFRRADEARALCVAMHAPLQNLIDCLAQHGCYHIPTLLQLSLSFEITGDTAHAQELMDLALYHVGILLSHIRIEATWQQRQLPVAYESNKLLFRVMARSVHVALRRGCTRTAWEMAKFILSLDPTDPEGMLLQLDYAALRAKRWVWLVKVQHLAHQRVSEEGSDTGLMGRLNDLVKGATPTLSQHDVVGLLALDLLRMPGFAFGAALAKHFLEREREREAESEAQQQQQPRYRSKVLRDATEEERQLLANAPSAERMLATAIVAFPEAAQCLLEALQGIDVVCRGAPRPVDPFWSDTAVPVVERHRDLDGWEEIWRVAELFAARHADIWKAQETLGFLRAAFTHEKADATTSWLAKADAEMHLAADASVCGRVARLGLPAWAGGGTPLRTGVGSMRRYVNITKDEVLGSVGTAIPADLLAQAQQPADGRFMDEGAAEDEEEEEVIDEALQRELRRVTAASGPLNDVERDALLRLRALYGPLDPEAFPLERQQLAEYRQRLSREGVMRQMLGGRNLIELFFRTLAPWGTTEDMVLNALLQERDIEDPVQRRQQEGRQADERIWAEDEAAAESAEDSEAEWASLHSDGSGGDSDNA